jgi:putative ABC transport system permease protein
MLRNFFTTALRSLKKNLGFSVINILGLSIGLACSVLIMVFVWHELSYDKYNVKAERIYRIAQKALIGNTQINQTWTPAPMPEALYKEFPEVEAVTRITEAENQTVNFNERVFIEKQGWIADSSLFDVFTFRFIKGIPKAALAKPNMVVITQSMAFKYFGNDDPIGKVLVMSDNSSSQNYEVSAVIEDVPDNSHFHFDFIISLVSFKGFYDSQQWFNNNFFTYIALKEGVDIKGFEAKIPAFTDKYLFGGNYEKLKAEHKGYWEIYLQPLLEIHLNSDITGEFEPNGRKSYVYIFFIVAIIILLIACINFMNLNTAKSSTRSKEVGVRKVVGASRKMLMFQFVGESILTSFIAMAIGMAIAETLLPAYGNLVGRNLEIHYFNNFYVLPLLFMLAATVGLISGSYPAFFLSSFKPVNVLKGKALGVSKSPWLRNTLVIIQFTMSIVLIISTLLIYKQLDFLQNQQLGFDKEQVIVLKNPYALGKNSKVFSDEVKKCEGVENVTFSTSLPGKMFNNIGFRSDGKENFSLNLCLCDPGFIDVMKLEMKEGRFFSDEFLADTSAVILNESAVKLLEWDEPIGKVINGGMNRNINFRVIGVVKDFYFESKHQKVRPMALFFLNGSFSRPPNFVSVRVKSDKIAATIATIEKNWGKFANGLSLDYTFLNDEYDILYKNEKQTQQLFIVFSVLAIFIACLGLLGLTSYLAELRTKEIGIRKVMGATVSTITLILSTNFLKWVVISNVIAWPLAYYLMTEWLENFAYKVSLSWWMFALAALLSIFIAIITINYQSIKAATRNPIDSLRYE